MIIPPEESSARIGRHCLGLALLGAGGVLSVVAANPAAAAVTAAFATVLQGALGEVGAAPFAQLIEGGDSSLSIAERLTNHDLRRVAGQVVVMGLWHATEGVWEEPRRMALLKTAHAEWERIANIQVEDLKSLERAGNIWLVANSHEGPLPEDTPSLTNLYLRLLDRPKAGDKEATIRPRTFAKGRWGVVQYHVLRCWKRDPGGDIQIAERAAKWLKENFASSFIALLRSDDRANRAMVTYVLQENHKLALWIRDGIEELKKPQPELYNFASLAQDHGLNFKFRSLRFLSLGSFKEGSQSWARQRITEHFREKGALQIAILSGPPGIGKSRLALEIVNDFALQGWNTGFYDARGWKAGFHSPLTDTLIVVDEASYTQISVGETTCSVDQWLEHLNECTHRKDWNGQTLRVLLLDRQPDSVLFGGEDAVDAQPLLESLTLRCPLAPNADDYLLTFEAEHACRSGKALSVEIQSFANGFLEDNGVHHARPLIAILLAQLVASHHASQVKLNLFNLLLEVLSQEKHRWEEANLLDSHIDGLIVATVLGEVSFPEVQSIAAFPEKISAVQERALISMTDAETLNPWRAIEPTLVGEALVLARLADMLGVEKARLSVVQERARQIWQTLMELYPVKAIRFGSGIISNFGRSDLPAVHGACTFIWKSMLEAMLSDEALVSTSAIRSAASAGIISYPSALQGLERTLIGQLSIVAGWWDELFLQESSGNISREGRSSLFVRLDSLHETYGYEPAVREQLARALCNLTVGQDKVEDLQLTVAQIETLHETYGYEPAVRAALARALCNTAARQGDDPLGQVTTIKRLSTLSVYGPLPRRVVHSALTLLRGLYVVCSEFLRPDVVEAQLKLERLLSDAYNDPS